MKKIKNPSPLTGEWVKTADAVKYLGYGSASRSSAIRTMRDAGVKQRETPGPRGRPMYEWSCADVSRLRLLRTGKAVPSVPKIAEAAAAASESASPPKIEKPSDNGVPTADGSIMKVLLRIIEGLAEGRDSRLPGIARAVADGHITPDDATYILHRT